jgi:hypothetical protein
MKSGAEASENPDISLNHDRCELNDGRNRVDALSRSSEQSVAPAYRLATSDCDAAQLELRHAGARGAREHGASRIHAHRR